MELEWFDAKKFIPPPKRLDMYRYSIEAISSKGDLVCWDFKDKSWKEIVIEDNKVTYEPTEITEWTNKPYEE